MTDEMTQLVAVLAAGVGLIITAGAGLMTGSAGRRGRAVALLVPAGLAVAVGGALGGPAGAGLAAGLLAVTVGGTAALGAGLLRRPAVRWGMVAAAGVGAVGWSVGNADNQLVELQTVAGLAAMPPQTAAAATSATTDAGEPVALFEPLAPRSAGELRSYEDEAMLLPRRGAFIRREAADDRCNCHGWVFAGGRYWMSGAAVDQVLAGNGYAPAADPRPGDVVVYRSGGLPVHSGVVRYTAPDQPVMVEGKWGSGGVYLHAVGESMYGDEFSFYRTARGGHLLAGLGGPATADPTTPVAADAVAPPATGTAAGW